MSRLCYFSGFNSEGSGLQAGKSEVISFLKKDRVRNEWIGNFNVPADLWTISENQEVNRFILCSMQKIYRRFGGMCCLKVQG
jgi:hypothetical protein